MIVLNPARVTFGSVVLERVGSVVVDRATAREVVAWLDEGPEVVLADSAERRVTVKVTRSVVADELGVVSPGEGGTLRFFASSTASEAGRVRVSIEGVVMKVSHAIESGKGAVQTITLTGVSADGVADPVVVEEV